MKERRRRMVVGLLLALAVAGVSFYNASVKPAGSPDNNSTVKSSDVQSVRPGPNPTGYATESLGKLAVKGRAPKTGYTRSQFGDGWADTGGCNVRERILARDMTDIVTLSAEDCRVRSGNLNDPYTARQILFARGPSTSSIVQIDHVVALSDAWQKGAQQLSPEAREQLANDPLELLAVDGKTNNDKSDGDAATWLPPNTDYRCRYVARQIAIKLKYSLWVTAAERDAMDTVLKTCPDQQLPVTQ